MAKITSFHEIAVGKEFTMNGIKYIKIPDQRINCCKVFNAAEIANTENKIQVIPITQVEIDD